MKYYSAPISIKDGKKVYGNLPIDFVLGYEDLENSSAYFELTSNVHLDEENGVTEIEKNDYEIKVANINKEEAQKRNTEQQKIIEDMLILDEQRRKEIEQLKESQKSADKKYKELDISTTPLSDYQSAKISQLKEKCNQSIEAGFISPSMGYFFGFKEHDQRNFKGQAIVFLIDPSETQCEWKTEDAGVITIAKEDFMKLIPEGKEHTRKNTDKYWDLVNKVNSAKTNLAVSEITWN